MTYTKAGKQEYAVGTHNERRAKRDEARERARKR